MPQRSLLICLITAALLLAGVGAPVLSASAEPRAITATLSNGQVVPLTVDAAPGTPLANVGLPADLLPLIVSISDGTTTVQVADLSANQQTPATSASGPTGSRGLTNNKSSTEPASSSEGKGSGIPNTDPEVDRSTSSGEGFTNPDAKLEDDAPAPGDPDYSLALPGPAPIGVPNFFIDRFRIPPFLLPIYQAAGTEYGVRWEILAAINEIETDYGRNLNVSSAGALGWMQFMPDTWKTYGTDANDDGRRDPYNPVDAIFAAARYLRAAGADKDIRAAVFAYNHADWYVDSVMLRAKLISGLPADLVGSLTGLTQGRFPVDAKARYAGAIDIPDATQTVATGENAAVPVDGSSSRKAIRIFAATGSDVIAVHDGKITAIGVSDRLGRYIRLRDVFGNTYTYAHLGEVAPTYEVRVPEEISDEDLEQELSAPPSDPQPTTSATAGKQGESGIAFETATPGIGAPTGVFDTRRVFATGLSGQVDPKPSPDGVTEQPLVVGSEVTAGTELGRIGDSPVGDPHLEFSIRPAGHGAPKIDPKPILDGWKLLETTAIYRAADKNPFFGPDAQQPTAGQILLMSKDSLIQRVLADPRIDVYECGRRDIRAGIIDRRVLATLEFLATSGLEPTVTSLRCGHSHLTKSGRVSYHSSGNAVDIAAINGTPILGNQGPDSITDTTVRKLLTLQGAMKPAEIITLMTYEDTDNTFALSDHADHIHVGFRPADDPALGEQFNALLKPSQWNRLMDRLNQIENPIVPAGPSKYSIESETGSHSHD